MGAEREAMMTDVGVGRAVTSTPTWFGRPASPQFGFVHTPTSGAVRGMAVLCPPLGREAANALPAFQVVGDRLAADGIAALRFDYNGTGDSAGAWGDPDRLDEWVTGIEEAVDFARRATEAPVVLIGMRMGALLAAEAVARGTTVTGMVLWDPCPSGRDFLRREVALLATTYSAPQAGDGSVNGPAFTYSKETAAELEGLILGPGPEAHRTRTVVLARTGLSSMRSARARFAATAAEWQEVEGQPGLMEAYPDTLVLPEQAMTAVCRWTGSLLDQRSFPILVHPVPSARVLTSADGRSISERAVRLGPNQLFGVRTEPDDAEEDRLPTAVFLSAGALDHTGPGRQWVALARRFAGEGIPAIRVDLDGIGESFGRPGRPRNIPKPAEAIDDLADLAAALDDPDGRRLVFVGLSSGAYHALEAGLRLRPLGVCAINPGLRTGFAEAGTGRIDPRRRVVSRMPRSLRALATKHSRIATWLWRALLQVRVRESPHASVAGVCRRGARLLLVLAEPERAQYERSLYWSVVERRLRRRGLLDIRVIRGADHSLYTVDGQNQAYPVLTSWMTARFARSAAGTAPRGPERPGAGGLSVGTDATG